MLTAEQARNISNERYLADLPITEFVDILEKIDVAVLEGKTSIEINNLNRIIKKLLKNVVIHLYFMIVSMAAIMMFPGKKLVGRKLKSFWD